MFSWRMIATGTALAAAFATFGVAGTASAAPYSAVTKADAVFVCVSNCQAGGVGAVKDGAGVVAAQNPDLVDWPRVGAWERTVHVYCKTGSAGLPYQVTVQDKNWAGRWNITAQSLKTPAADSLLPAC